jgi:hypothetical protein
MNVHQRRVHDIVYARDGERRGRLIQLTEAAAAGRARRRRHFLSPAQIEDERLRGSGDGNSENDSGSETGPQWIQGTPPSMCVW